MRRHATLIMVFAAQAALSIAGLSVLVAAPATAHDALVSTSPEDGATVTGSPDVVELTFNNPVQNQFGEVAVLGSDDAEYQQGEPDVVGATVTQPIAELSDGRYTVAYRIVSSDGHPVSGSFSFTVQGSSAGAPESTRHPETTPAPVTSASEDDGTGAATVVAVVAGGAVAVAAIAYVAAGGRRRPAGGTEG